MFESSIVNVSRRIPNPLLFSGVVGWPFLLEGSSPVLEEFLLPAVEDRWLESHFIAPLRGNAFSISN
jgi:hypothetical protein